MPNLESIPIIEYDNFLKSKFITWSCVGGRGLTEKYSEGYFDDSFVCYFDKNSDQLLFIFSFRFYDNKTYLVIKFTPKEYKLKVNNSINFLFENETLLNFIVTTEPYKAGVYESECSLTKNGLLNSKYSDYYETLIPISLNDIELFTKYKLNNFAINLKSYKLIGGNDKEKRLWRANPFGNNDPTETNKKTFQEALILFASTFLEVIKKEVPEYEEAISNVSDETCYVYLMHDLKNNFYKIGISNSPVYREKTLQSEKPTIILIKSKCFPKRKIAEILEKTLHDNYSNKRIRGEWFSLNTEDINDISQILNE